MKKVLVQQINNNIATYEAQLLECIKRYAYEKDRYGINYSIAIAITNREHKMDDFQKTIRLTDSFVSLDENLYGVIFASADTELGIKAASNLLHKFEMQFFNSSIYLGIISSEDENDGTKMVKKLFTTLTHSIVEGMQNMPIDYKHISNQYYAV